MGVRGERIAAVGIIPERDGAELDATGLAVSPGLPAAIHRMTGMPAAKFKLADRGQLRPNAFADLVVFDPSSIADTATYEDPKRFPAGIRAVYVNGTPVADNGAHTGARPGRTIRPNKS